MNDIIGSYFIRNNQPIGKEFFDLANNLNPTIVIYEVIRILNGKVLFYNDHIERFQNSLTQYGYTGFTALQSISGQLSLLIECNKIENGNIKFLLRFSASFDFYAFFIPHKYPSANDYINGIYISTLFAERINPHIKQQNIDLNKQVLVQLAKTKAYELLLVRVDGNITEGSKSNFFLIKEKEIYTAYEKDILPGITRKHILNLCHQLGITVIEANIPLNNLGNYDAAFISGTSPKILPIRLINNITFDVKNSLLMELMKGFDRIIEENLVSLEKI
jgi:branched-chain amino acid aminotransferase